MELRLADRERVLPIRSVLHHRERELVLRRAALALREQHREQRQGAARRHRWRGGSERVGPLQQLPSDGGEAVEGAAHIVAAPERSVAS